MRCKRYSWLTIDSFDTLWRDFVMSVTIDEKLAGALATAVMQKPRANLQQIASMAGISKATLYRISPTRESVIALLTALSREHIENALQRADLSSSSFKDALVCLTEGVMKNRPFYLFWCASLWMDMSDLKNQDMKGYSPSFYSEALESFFLRGQMEGVFRVDLTATWLAKSYDFLLYAAAESAERGEIASVGISDMVCKTFFDGSLIK